MKNKGFTLIEILAVIIILGIIMMIAIPNVSKNIMDSRKKTDLVDAERYVEAGRNAVESHKIPCPSTETTYYIPRVCVPTEKGHKSPYAEWKDVYVVVTYDGLKHYYYFTSLDEAGYGIELTNVDDLTEKSIKQEKKSGVDLNVGVGSRTIIKVYKTDCETTELRQATSFIEGK